MDIVATEICETSYRKLWSLFPGNKRLYCSVLDCFQKTYTTEGIRGLYKGAGPLYLRIAPHTTLSLVIWDMLNSVLDAHKVS